LGLRFAKLDRRGVEKVDARDGHQGGDCPEAFFRAHGGYARGRPGFVAERVAEFVALVPPGVVTVTSTVPSALGSAALIEVPSGWW
jgi:hypothetical protein